MLRSAWERPVKAVIESHHSEQSLLLPNNQAVQRNIWPLHLVQDSVLWGCRPSWRSHGSHAAGGSLCLNGICNLKAFQRAPQQRCTNGSSRSCPEMANKDRLHHLLYHIHKGNCFAFKCYTGLQSRSDKIFTTSKRWCSCYKMQERARRNLQIALLSISGQYLWIDARLD